MAASNTELEGENDGEKWRRERKAGKYGGG